MRIERLQLQQYRSIDREEIFFDPKLTIFCGANGSGKTNILEAVSLLSVPRSFRGNADKELISWGQSFGRVEGEVVLADQRRKQLVVFLEKDKKLQVDGQVQPMTQFLGQFLSVLFAPEDVEMLAGPPSVRRAWLDGHLSALSPTYLHHLLSYHQVLRQRNRLLSRTQRPDIEELDYWNTQQLEHGSAIVEARVMAVDQINLILPSSLRFEYICSLVGEDSVAEIFHRKQAGIIDREIYVGHTLLGPQRDDWRLRLDTPAIDLGVFGSRGQQRMGVVALKQAQLQIITAEKGEPGVLLLDDVLSELDAQNQQLLLQSVAEQQTVMTTASLSDVPEVLLKEALIYELADGKWQSKIQDGKIQT